MIAHLKTIAVIALIIIACMTFVWVITTYPEYAGFGVCLIVFTTIGSLLYKGVYDAVN